MNAEDTFNIEVAENNRTILLTVKRNEEHGEKKYDVFNDRNVHLFSLDCCTDKVKDTYKLSAEFEGKKIDPILIKQVNEILMSEEE